VLLCRKAASICGHCTSECELLESSHQCSLGAHTKAGYLLVTIQLIQRARICLYQLSTAPRDPSMLRLPRGPWHDLRSISGDCVIPTRCCSELSTEVGGAGPQKAVLLATKIDRAAASVDVPSVCDS